MIFFHFDGFDRIKHKAVFGEDMFMMPTFFQFKDGSKNVHFNVLIMLKCKIASYKK